MGTIRRRADGRPTRSGLIDYFMYTSDNGTHPGEAWRRSLSVPSQPRSASLARAFVREQAQGAGFAPDDVAEIEVAVGEAVTNAILYGTAGTTSCPPAIALIVGLTGSTMWIEVRDSGPGFDHAARSAAVRVDDPDALGGRGLHIMEALMDRVHLHHDGTGMRIRLERGIPSAT